jgi:hypothetical protein
MELWKSVESAMRAMLGGSSLSGQELVRDLRQRGELSLEQANALASFFDTRGRVADVAYKPTLTDVGVARSGYNALTSAVNDTTHSATSAAATPASTFAPGGMSNAGVINGTTAAPTVTTEDGAVISDVPLRATSVWRAYAPILIGIVVLLLVIGGAVTGYFMLGSRKFDKAMASAVQLMTSGRTEAARGAFGALTRQYPDKAAPHVYLSRLARTQTPPDMNAARQELIVAIRLEPGYEPAQREMGLFQLASRNPSLARNFLIRAVQLDPTDSAAQGYLGCALIGLGRTADGQKFLGRAGQGTWSACAAPATQQRISP